MTEESAPGEARVQFVTTHWSMVRAAGGTLSHEQREALERLCRAYWYPLYAYVRRAGNDREEAKDLTQGFLAHLLEKGTLGLADQKRGRFRTFLLTTLKHYLIDEARRQNTAKRGGGKLVEHLEWDDGEERYHFEPTDPAAAPDVLYDRGWARAVVEQALARLRQEYAASRNGPGFDALKQYVWGERSGLSCAKLGQEIGLSEEAAKKAVQRMRRRFAQVLREQIAETVSTPAELQEELRYLASLLG